MKASVVVPAKGFTHAKRRLASHLSARERRAVAEAMLRHVLEQVRLSRGVDETFVVTADAEVACLALSLGTQVIPEREETGESRAVSLALDELGRSGVRGVLVIPGDLPLLQSVDIEFVLDEVPQASSAVPFALLVPSRDRMGTNGLFLTPPGVIRPQFGHDSFCRHLSEVSAKGIPFKVLENRRIALDVDEPLDLEHTRAETNGGGSSGASPTWTGA